MGRRLTRKEIVREDRIHAVLFRLYEWGSRNSRTLAVAMGVLVLAIAAGYLWRQYQHKRSDELQLKFAEALQVYHASVGEEPQLPDQPPAAASEMRFQTAEERNEEALRRFQELSREYQGHPFGYWALYYQGLVLDELGRREEARPLLEQVIEGAPQPDLKNLARNYLAQIALDEKRPEEAARLYQAILDEPSNSMPPQVTLMQLARSHEAAGNWEEALKYYRRITTEYPLSQDSRLAESKVNELEARTQQRSGSQG